MKLAARVLTALVVVVLTTNLPVAAMSCEPEQTNCAVGSEPSDCCAPSGCHCDMSSRDTPSPRNEAAALAGPNTGVAAKAVTTASVTLRSFGADGASVVASRAASSSSSQPPAYTLTHAFLI